MRSRICLMAALGGLGLLSLVPAFAGKTTFSKTGGNLPSLSMSLQIISEEGKRCEQLTRLSEAVNSRLSEKNRISLDLKAGRLSLAEAAEKFRLINSHDPKMKEYLALAQLGNSEAEWMLGHVIDWCLSLEKDSRKAKVLEQRLLGEMANCLAMQKRESRP